MDEENNASLKKDTITNTEKKRTESNGINKSINVINILFFISLYSIILILVRNKAFTI